MEVSCHYYKKFVTDSRRYVLLLVKTVNVNKYHAGKLSTVGMYFSRQYIFHVISVWRWSEEGRRTGLDTHTLSVVLHCHPCALRKKIGSSAVIQCHTVFYYAHG